MGAETAFPLEWPAGRQRTQPARRQRAQFQVNFASARDHLMAELSRLGARYPILSTNIPLRRDGLPYANQPEPDDPGAAVYFEFKGTQMAFACDRWDRVKDNIRAVGKTIEALRGLERWGTGEMVSAAFVGFQALPESIGDHWSDVLGVPSDAPKEQIRRAYVRRRSESHPDNGGDAQEFHRVTQAWEEAQYEIRKET